MKTPHNFSPRRKVLFIFLVWLTLMLLGEVGSRTFFFVTHGFNPYYLTYGIVRDIEWHSDEYDGYTKFQAHSIKHQRVGAETIAIHINGQGYRSRYDYTTPKPPNVFRVATLGESSTFGYFNRDNETYPFQLEKMLREEYPQRKIEVLNLGIPHFRIENILSQVRAELRDLNPVVVTLYAGYNNSMLLGGREEANLVYRAKDWLYFHSVAWRATQPLVKEVYYKVTRLLNKDVAQLPHLDVPVVLSEYQVNKIRAKTRQDFRVHLEALADVIDLLEGRLILVTQSYTLQKLPRSGLKGGWSTYHDEVSHVERILREKGRIPAIHSTLLIHRDLMEVLRAVADERHLALVEGIDVLEQDRAGMMASYVHLTPAGNKRIAAAIRDTIVAQDLLANRAHSSLSEKDNM